MPFDDKLIVEDWPDPDAFEDDSWDEDEDNFEVDEPEDVIVTFKVKQATSEEIGCLNRYLFDAIAKELEIPYSKLEDLEIEED